MENSKSTEAGALTSGWLLISFLPFDMWAVHLGPCLGENWKTKKRKANDQGGVRHFLWPMKSVIDKGDSCILLAFQRGLLTSSVISLLKRWALLGWTKWTFSLWNVHLNQTKKILRTLELIHSEYCLVFLVLNLFKVLGFHPFLPIWELSHHLEAKFLFM